MIVCGKGKGCSIEGTGEQIMNDFGNIVVTMMEMLREEFGYGAKDFLMRFTDFCIRKSEEVNDEEIGKKYEKILDPYGALDILEKMVKGEDDNG